MDTKSKKLVHLFGRMIFIFLVLVIIMTMSFSLLSTSSEKVKPAYALVNCLIFPVSTQPIGKGTIIIRDGLIEAVGSSDKIPAPPDAEVIEASGLNAYPGMISAHTNLFLEIKEQQRAQSAEEFLAAYTQPSEPQEFPELLVLKEIKPKK